MRQGKEYIGKPVYSISEGKRLGWIHDLYFDATLNFLVALSIRSNKPFCRDNKYIHRDHIFAFGKDVILTRFSEVVVNVSDYAIPDNWIKRESLFYKQIVARDGRSVGRLGDILLNADCQITGFTLSQVFIDSPLDQNLIISREAVINVGDIENKLVIDLKLAEKTDLILENQIQEM